MSRALSVFVVDDDAAARDSIAALVKANGVRVQSFASALDFLEAYDGATPGCVIADVRMPGMSGLELQATLHERGLELPMIVVTGHGDVSTAVHAMRQGAVTFLEKPCRTDELWANIQGALDLAARKHAQSEELAEIDKRISILSAQEHEVLTAMVAGKPNKVVAAELDVSLRTVELRRAKVLEKMRAESLAEVVRMALLSGRFGQTTG